MTLTKPKSAALDEFEISKEDVTEQHLVSIQQDLVHPLQLQCEPRQPKQQQSELQHFEPSKNVRQDKERKSKEELNEQQPDQQLSLQSSLKQKIEQQQQQDELHRAEQAQSIQQPNEEQMTSKKEELDIEPLDIQRVQNLPDQQLNTQKKKEHPSEKQQGELPQYVLAPQHTLGTLENEQSELPSPEHQLQLNQKKCLPLLPKHLLQSVQLLHPLSSDYQEQPDQTCEEERIEHLQYEQQQVEEPLTQSEKHSNQQQPDERPSGQQGYEEPQLEQEPYVPEPHQHKQLEQQESEHHLLEQQPHPQEKQPKHKQPDPKQPHQRQSEEEKSEKQLPGQEQCEQQLPEPHPGQHQLVQPQDPDPHPPVQPQLERQLLEQRQSAPGQHDLKQEKQLFVDPFSNELQRMNISADEMSKVTQINEGLHKYLHISIMDD